MNSLESLLHEHFPERLRHGQEVTRIDPPIPLFVLVGALSIDPETLESKVRKLETEYSEDGATQALESWVLDRTDTVIQELLCFEFPHWHGQIRAIQVFMVQVEGMLLLGTHEVEYVPSWCIDGIVPDHKTLHLYVRSLDLPREPYLRCVNCHPELISEADLARTRNP